MSPTFTPDDVGKTVESADGEALGVVAAVDQTTAYVEPDPGVTDSIKAALDWHGDSESVVPLAGDAVREISDDAVTLEAEFPEESITSADAGGDGGEREGEGAESGSARGEPVADTVTEIETDATGGNTGDGTRDLDESEPVVDDEFYDAPEGGARVDPDDEMDELEDEESTDEIEANEATDAVGETDSVEAETSRELDVDPTELTDGEPEAEIEPGEDVGKRADVGTAGDDSTDEGDDSAPEGPTAEDRVAGELETATDRRPDADESDAEVEGKDRDEDSTGGGERDGGADR